MIIGKVALVTGLTGQDGSYLAELLLSKGYHVHGMVRRTSSLTRERIDPIAKEYLKEDGWGPKLFLHYGDMTDSSDLNRLIADVKPDEVYNLAAQSHVQVSFTQPEFTGNADGLGVVRLLEAIRLSGKPTRFYQASTSEMFGSTPAPQNELTTFHPRSPYAAAKVYAHYITQNYRESYGMFACSGILFNHESPRRGENFVTRKVTRGIAQVLKGEGPLILGNLDAKRDWGFAGDYVEAMWRILQQDDPEDYVIGTGKTRSVQDLVETAFDLVGLNWKENIKTDPKFVRPAEVDELRADATKAQTKLGWKPKTSFEDMIRMMLETDLKAAGLDPKKYLKKESPKKKTTKK